MAKSSKPGWEPPPQQPGRQPPRADQIQLAAYYFPNWGPVAQSEWPTLQAAKPRFEGHAQPKVPVWGYENENDPVVMARKIAAAADHGIDAFIFDLNVSMGWDSSPRCPANADWMKMRGYPFGAVIVDDTAGTLSRRTASARRNSPSSALPTSASSRSTPGTSGARAAILSQTPSTA